MADIGRLAVSLVLNNTGIAPAMAETKKQLLDLEGLVAKLGAIDFGQGLATRLGNLGGVASKILSGSLGGGVSDALGLLKGVPPVVGQITEAFGQVPGPIGVVAQVVGKVVIPAVNFLKDTAIGATQELIAMGERGMARIRDQARMARQFGMSLSSAAGLQLLSHQVGQDPEELAGGFFHLNRSIAQARGGNIDAQASFRSLGVSMAAVRTGDTAAILNTISTAVRNNGDAIENTDRLSQVFGRRGVASMTRLLYQEGDALSEATRRAQTFGLVVSAADAAAVSAANRARQRMAADWNALWQGLENRMGVALAPAWQQLASSFDLVITMAQPAFASLREFIDNVGVAAGRFTSGFKEGLELLKPGLEATMLAFEEIAAVLSILVNGSERSALTWEQTGQIVAGVFVESLRLGARLILANVVAGLSLYEGFRRTVAVVDTLINALRRAYTQIRDNAVALSNGLIDPGEIGGRDSNMAGGLADTTEALSRARQALADLNNGITVTDRSVQRAAARRVAEAARAARELAEAAARGDTGISSDAWQRTIRTLQQQRDQVVLTADAYRQLQLRQQGASQTQIDQAQGLSRATELARVMQQHDDARAFAAQQITGLEDTAAASRTLAEAQLRLSLANQGLAQSEIDLAVSALRRNQQLARQLTLLTQARDLAQQQLAQARLLESTTQLQEANPLLSPQQAQRQAQIAETARQLAEQGSGGFYAIAMRLRLEALRAADAQLALAEMLEAGRQLGESLRNPLEAYNDSMDRFNHLLEEGAIDWQTWGRAAQQAAERLIAATAMPNAGASALSQGSAAAITAVNQQRRDDGQGSVAERTARAVEAQRQIQQQQLETLRLLLRAQYGEEAAAAFEFLNLPPGGG